MIRLLFYTNNLCLLSFISGLYIMFAVTAVRFVKGV